MSITKKGVFWEMKNSYYMLFPFTLLLCGLGIFIAGKKARVSKWKKQGLIYLGLFWVLFATFDMFGETVKDFLAVGLIIVVGVCIVKSFSIRKEYLMRLEVLKDTGTEEFEENKLRNQIKNEYGLAGSKRKEHININTKEHSKIVTEESKVSEYVPLEKEPKEKIEQAIILIDINRCSQGEFQGLPGFTIITAKKAIKLREEKNGFKNVGEFIKDMDIKEYHIEKIKSLIKCEGKDAIHEVKTTGRMVDF